MEETTGGRESGSQGGREVDTVLVVAVLVLTFMALVLVVVLVVVFVRLLPPISCLVPPRSTTKRSRAGAGAAPVPELGKGGARTGGDAAADEDEDDGDEEQQPSNARGRGGGCAHASEVVPADLRERFSKASCSPPDALGNSCRRGCLPSSQPRVDELDVLRSPSCGHRVHSSVAPVAQG